MTKGGEFSENDWQRYREDPRYLVIKQGPIRVIVSKTDSLGNGLSAWNNIMFFVNFANQRIEDGFGSDEDRNIVTTYAPAAFELLRKQFPDIEERHAEYCREGDRARKEIWGR